MATTPVLSQAFDARRAFTMAWNLFSQGAFWRIGYMSDRHRHRGWHRPPPNKVYLLLIALWRLGGTAHIQPDLGPSQLHPIAIYQYWSFSAEHGQL